MATVIRVCLHWLLDCGNHGCSHGSSRRQISRRLVSCHHEVAQSVSNSVQSGTRSLCYGYVGIVLLRFYPSYRLHHLVRHPIVLCWQCPLCNAALHLRKLLGELQQHAFRKCEHYFKAAPGILHGLAHGIPIRKLRQEDVTNETRLTSSRCGSIPRIFITSSLSKVSRCPLPALLFSAGA